MDSGLGESLRLRIWVLHCLGFRYRVFKDLRVAGHLRKLLRFALLSPPCGFVGIRVSVYLPVK